VYRPAGTATVSIASIVVRTVRPSRLFCSHDTPAGQQVTVLETYNTNRHNRNLTLLVAYTGKDGKERMGWFCGTLNVHYPH